MKFFLKPKSFVVCAIVLSSATAHTKPPVLDKVIESFLVARNLPGLAVGIESPKFKVQKWFKNPQIKTNYNVDSKTRFSIGSITKSFTSCLVHQMVKEGMIALDLPLARYLDDIPAGWEDIAIAQLLQHTSGIPEYTAVQPKPDYTKPISFAQIVKLLSSTASKFDPGTQQDYSNTNYLLLGRVLEKVSGKTYAQLIQERICQPLRLRNTGFAGTMDTKNLIPGMQLKLGGGIFPAKVTDPTWLASAGGIESSLEDMMKFSDGLTLGKIFPSELLSAALIPPTVEKGAMAYGSGFILGQLNGKPMIGHNGRLEGYESFWLTSLDGKLKIVLLANSDQAQLEPLLIELLQRIDVK